MDETSMSQNRRSGRLPVLLSARIEVDGTEVSVVLRNLSPEGALIEGARLPPGGATTTFQRNELKATGRIVWVEGRFAGLAFDRRLEREEVLRHVPRPQQRVETQFRRPGFACEPLSEADRRMVQLWTAPRQLRDGEAP